MRFITISSMLLGAALAVPAPAPAPQSDATLDRRGPSITVSDIVIEATADDLHELKSVSIKMSWDDKKVSCTHVRGLFSPKHQCRGEDGKTDKAFHFHFGPGYLGEGSDHTIENRVYSWVSRKTGKGDEDDTYSMDMGKLTCNGGSCKVEHDPAIVTKTSPPFFPGRQRNISVTDVELKSSNGAVLESASIKLSWDSTESWCFHKGQKHGCHDIDNYHTNDLHYTSTRDVSTT